MHRAPRRRCTHQCDVPDELGCPCSQAAGLRAVGIGSNQKKLEAASTQVYLIFFFVFFVCTRIQRRGGLALTRAAVSANRLVPLLCSLLRT
jgi:hypothetical protein